MTTRAQRKRKAKDTELKTIADKKIERLGISPEFVDETIDSNGIVSVTFNSRGQAGNTVIHAGRVTNRDLDGLVGDGLMNMWKLPKIDQFRISDDGDVKDVESRVSAIDVSDPWIKATNQLEGVDPSAPADSETNLVLSRQGFETLIQNMGGTALANSLRTIDQQVFEDQKSN